MQVQWLGKMDFGFHAVTCEIRPQLVTTLGPYDQQVVEISGLRRNATHLFRKALHVEGCDLVAFVEPIIKMRQLNAQDGSLHFVHT